MPAQKISPREKIAAMEAVARGTLEKDFYVEEVN